jgi:hypothetical protein
LIIFEFLYLILNALKLEVILYIFL